MIKDGKGPATERQWEDKKWMNRLVWLSFGNHRIT
jgi:hypothetical protein